MTKQRSITFEAEIRKQIHLNYLLHLPEDHAADPDKRWPLILFLHGMGERGDDLELVKLHAIPKVVEERDDFTFIAVSPQAGSPVPSTCLPLSAGANRLDMTASGRTSHSSERVRDPRRGPLT